MNEFLDEFNLSILHEIYCLKFMPSDGDSLSKNDLLEFFPIGVKNQISHILPKYDNNLIKVLSRHYLKIYCSLWSSPAEFIISASKHVISNYLVRVSIWPWCHVFYVPTYFFGLFRLVTYTWCNSKVYGTFLMISSFYSMLNVFIVYFSYLEYDF